jgi:hypothetical protein
LQRDLVNATVFQMLQVLKVSCHFDCPLRLFAREKKEAPPAMASDAQVSAQVWVGLALPTSQTAQPRRNDHLIVAVVAATPASYRLSIVAEWPEFL